MESRIENMSKKLSLNEDPKRYFPRRYTITISIYKCNNTTRPYTLGNPNLDTNLVNRRETSVTLYTSTTANCLPKTKKRTRNSNTRCVNIQSGQKGWNSAPTLKPLTQTASLFARVKKGRVLLRLEPWPWCSKNQLQSSNNQNY